MLQKKIKVIDTSGSSLYVLKFICGTYLKNKYRKQIDNQIGLKVIIIIKLST